MLGDWSKHFPFAPVPYGDGGAKRKELRNNIHSKITEQFFYSGEVRLTIHLSLNVQQVLETSETADLDNYAKAILDGLKGPGGILLDDCQVSALNIFWTDTFGSESPTFDVSISASPDDFIQKPVDFYEMADRLWYPISPYVWEDGHKKQRTDTQHAGALWITDAMAEAKARGRHVLRQQGGMHAHRAYWESNKFSSSSLRGYHRSRIDSGFQSHSRKEWLAKMEQLKAAADPQVLKLEELARSARDNLLQLPPAIVTLYRQERRR